MSNSVVQLQSFTTNPNDCCTGFISMHYIVHMWECRAVYSMGWHDSRGPTRVHAQWPHTPTRDLDHVAMIWHRICMPYIPPYWSNTIWSSLSMPHLHSVYFVCPWDILPTIISVNCTHLLMSMSPWCKSMMPAIESGQSYWAMMLSHLFWWSVIVSSIVNNLHLLLHCCSK